MPDIGAAPLPAVIAFHGNTVHPPVHLRRAVELQAGLAQRLREFGARSASTAIWTWPIAGSQGWNTLTPTPASTYQALACRSHFAPSALASSFSA